jgi:hypothetical protein
MFGLCLGHFFPKNEQMASQVAPGYNPEVSLLQGGNAPILPVQGGGSMTAGSSLPPDYNPNNSLLNTGSSAPIVPIRGGGNEQSGGGETAYKDYSIERYEIPLTSEEIPVIDPSVLKADLQAKIREYRGAVEPTLKKLSSFIRDPVRYTSEDIDNPTFRICPTETRNISGLFLKKVRRRIVTITEENPVIWLIPDIQGEISKFIQYMKLLSEPDKKLKAGTYVLFVGKFFSTSWQDNAYLYKNFLERKLLNPNNLFALTNITYEFAKACCDLYRNTYAEVGLDRTLAPFLEPDVILFKKQHIVIRSCELPIAEGTTDVKLSEILKKDSPEKYKDVILVPKQVNPTDTSTYDSLPYATGDAPDEMKYFTIDMNPDTTKFLEFPKQSTIVCPKGKTCQGFQGGYPLDQERFNEKGDPLPPLGKLDDRKLAPPQLYVIYKNTDKMPLLKEAGATLSPEELASLSPPKQPEEAAKPKEEPKPAATATATAAAKEEPIKEETRLPETDTFQADPLAWKTEIEVPVELNTFTFKLRTAMETKVKDDWLAGKYTQDEANFLTMLQVKPSLVEKAFGKKNGVKKVAEFLEQNSLSNCFEDTTLLSHRECSNAQAFVKDLYFAKLNLLLEQMYDELGILKPLDFMDALVILKAIYKKKPANVLQLGLDEFEGDFFDPFQKINYNATTDEYSIDFAQVPEGFPMGIKYFRLRSMDADAVIQAVLDALPKDVSPVEKKSLRNKLKDKFGTSPFKGALGGLKGAISPSRFSGLVSRKPRGEEEKEEEEEEEEEVPSTAAPSARPSFLSRLRTRRSSSDEEKKDESAPVTPAATGGFTLNALNSFSPPKDYFTTVDVKDDGLCFYRAVIKGQQASPVAETEGSDIYDPNATESLAFVTRVKNELLTNKASYEIGGQTFESQFNEKYARKGDEPEMLEEPKPRLGENGTELVVNGIVQYNGPELTAEQKKDRIKIGDKYFKMTYDEYLNRMDGPPVDRPFAEMDAGVGQAVATLTDSIIVSYKSESDAATVYMPEAIYRKSSYNSVTFPLSKILFLYNKGKNHYDLLKLKEGNDTPEQWPRPLTGGGDEELLDLGVAIGGGEEEMLDLGVAVMRRFTRRNKNRSHK